MYPILKYTRTMSVGKLRKSIFFPLSNTGKFSSCESAGYYIMLLGCSQKQETLSGRPSLIFPQKVQIPSSERSTPTGS